MNDDDLPEIREAVVRAAEFREAQRLSAGTAVTAELNAMAKPRRKPKPTPIETARVIAQATRSSPKLADLVRRMGEDAGARMFLNMASVSNAEHGNPDAEVFKAGYIENAAERKRRRKLERRAKRRARERAERKPVKYSSQKLGQGLFGEPVEPAEIGYGKRTKRGWV